MNAQFSTTGLVPLTIGSVEEFQLDPWLNRLPWFVSGGTVTLIVADPNGVQTSYAATILPTGYGAVYNWTVVGPATVDDNGVRLANPWRRAWKVVDSLGRVQVSRAFAFDVVASPA